MQEKDSFIRTGSGVKKEGALNMPLAEVAAVVITNGKEIMAVFNEVWGSFTLPMSKIRTWDNPNGGPDIVEPAVDAATRAAAEWLGCTFLEKPTFLRDIPRFQQSDRDRVWKEYHFHMFRLDLERGAPIPQGRNAQWLTPDEFLDARRRPISPTARHLLAGLKEKKKLL